VKTSFRKKMRRTLIYGCTKNEDSRIGKTDDLLNSNNGAPEIC
jgi:hypothetical protein